MSETQALGLGVCPNCHSPKARYSLTKKGLSCVTCNACNFQGFARSGRSDELLRDRIKAPPVDVSGGLTPTAAAVAAVADAPAQVEPPPAPKPAPKPPTETKPEAPKATGRSSFMSW